MPATALPSRFAGAWPHACRGSTADRPSVLARLVATSELTSLPDAHIQPDDKLFKVALGDQLIAILQTY